MSNELTTTRCDGICARCDGAGTIPDWSAGRLPCPACKPMVQSEATTAGRIRQSVDGTKRCPRCGAPLEGRNPFLPSYGRYECGSYERDDTATIECYRRQLVQAQAEVERLRREREIVRHRLRSARMHIPTSTPPPPDGKAAMKIGAKDPLLAYKIINDCIELLEGPNR